MAFDDLPIERASLPLSLSEMKFSSDAAAGTFAGYGSVFGNVDSYGDVIVKGAFRDSLREWKAKNRLPPMLVQHGGWMITDDDGIPVGKWTRMEEDSKGLYAEGRLINLDTDRGRRLYGAMKEGVLEGLSIGYRAKKWTVGTKPGEPRRKLEIIDLRELSVVTFPANDRALIDGVKGILTPMKLRDLEDALGERGLSRNDRVKAVSVFKDWLRRDAGEPDASPRDEEDPDAADVLSKLSALTDSQWSEVFRRR